jgi:hypothetical protein
MMAENIKAADILNYTGCLITVSGRAILRLASEPALILIE